MNQDVTVSFIVDSLTVFPKDNKTIIFQLGLVIDNPGSKDIIPLWTEIEVRSGLTWFSKSLHDFKIICEAAFCILRESTLRETFHFSMHQPVVLTEQKAFYEILNETKELQNALKFETIKFQLSDGGFISVPVGLVNLNSEKNRQ